jgi:hypothetical protein
VDKLEEAKAGSVEGPNGSGYYTAGIDMPLPMPLPGKYTLGETHFNAIEFHSKDRETAVKRRDYVLALLHAKIGVRV